MWIGVDLSREDVRSPREAGCDEAHECFLDQVLGEKVLQGIRLDRVLAARDRVLKELARTEPGSRNPGSEPVRWSAGRLRRLYPA